MADIPVKISDLDKSYALSASPVEFLINQIDDTGKYQTCTVPLSVVSKLAKEEAKKMLTTSVEIGTIIPYAGKVLSQESIKGWLLCNGRRVKKVEYPALWNLIREIYGPSTDEDFTLPDFKGRIEMGYSSTGESFEPNFGNWISGEKINLGEGNNPNYPDRGVFNIQLQNTDIQDHIHFVPTHKHKILNYSTIFNYKKLKLPRFSSVFGLSVPYVIATNWNYIGVYSPDKYTTYENSRFYHAYKGSGSMLHNNNYNSVKDFIFKLRKQGELEKKPISLIFNYTKDFQSEIDNRNKIIPEINHVFDNYTKNSSTTNEKGGNNYHKNIQPNITMNFLIKY